MVTKPDKFDTIEEWLEFIDKNRCAVFVSGEGTASPHLIQIMENISDYMEMFKSMKNTIDNGDDKKLTFPSETKNDND